MAVVWDTHFGSTRVIVCDDYILKGDALRESIKRFEEIATRAEIARQLAGTKIAEQAASGAVAVV